MRKCFGKLHVYIYIQKLFFSLWKDCLWWMIYFYPTTLPFLQLKDCWIASNQSLAPKVPITSPWKNQFTQHLWNIFGKLQVWWLVCFFVNLLNEYSLMYLKVLTKLNAKNKSRKKTSALTKNFSAQPVTDHSCTVLVTSYV